MDLTVKSGDETESLVQYDSCGAMDLSSSSSSGLKDDDDDHSAKRLRNGIPTCCQIGQIINFDFFKVIITILAANRRGYRGETL